MFVCSRLDLSIHDHSVPIARAVLVASVMVDLNVGNIISKVIYAVGYEINTNYPFTNSLSMYFSDLR